MRWSNLQACLLHALLLLLACALSALSAPTPPLQIKAAGALLPGVSLDWQTLEIGREVNEHLVSGTQPSTSYEIRVSHPSFGIILSASLGCPGSPLDHIDMVPMQIPASVQIRLGGEEEGAAVRSHQSLRRRLLDCDKLILRTSADNTVHGLTHPRVWISGTSTAVTPFTHRQPDGSLPTADNTLVYNIVLQPLALGLIPTDTLPTITVCVVLLLGVWRLLPWWTRTAVPALLRMDPACLELACGLVSKSYITQGGQALAGRHKQVKVLLSNRRLPQQGWDDASIQMFIQDCALMDSNNFLGNVGVGEREGRVACSLVAARHHRLAHGIGRSGDIAAEQPKAAGSSLLAKLTGCLAADALRLAGMGDLGSVSVLPLATGMTMTCCLMTLKATRPASARFVLWSRVDQKTCLKAITAAGLMPIVIELVVQGDELVTDMVGLEQTVGRLGVDNIAAVVTTTSCFAPRACDDVVGVAKLCATHGLPHMINNAYGAQSAAVCKLVTSAWRKGRVDVVVQSTDKNFMVPVGGALIMEGGRSASGVVDAVNKAYPGRASMTAHLDLIMTLLHWGAEGWTKVLREREALYVHLSHVLAETAAAHGQRVLATPGNPISLAVTLDQGALAGLPDHTFLGSMLWARCVSGTRVVGRGKKTSVAGIDFTGYGAHTDAYPHVYLTAAAAIGGSASEADEFCVRLDRCLREALAKAGVDKEGDKEKDKEGARGKEGDKDTDRDREALAKDKGKEALAKDN